MDLYVPVGAFFGDEADLDILLRNDLGAFTNVARQAGLTDSLSTDNAIWLDYNRDGHLDLFTGHRRSLPVENTLYRNNGDGTFTNATAAAGLDVALSVNFGSNGGMAAGDSLVSQLLGHGLAARLSARLGEGVINGLLTARVGIAAIAVCRPVPFVGHGGPAVSDVMGEMFRSDPETRALLEEGSGRA